MAKNYPTFEMLFSTSNSRRNNHKTFCCNLFEVRVFLALYWLQWCNKTQCPDTRWQDITKY